MKNVTLLHPYPIPILSLFHFTVHSGNHFLSIQEILIHFQSYIVLCVSVAWFIFPLSYMSI